MYPQSTNLFRVQTYTRSLVRVKFESLLAAAVIATICVVTVLITFTWLLSTFVNVWKNKQTVKQWRHVKQMAFLIDKDNDRCSTCFIFYNTLEWR